MPRRATAPGRARSLLERQVGLGREGRDADARQVAPSLVDDEATLPAREELPVERKQVVELEAALEREQGAPLELLQRRELALRSEEGGERREVERHPLNSVLARPRDRFADQPLVEPVRRRRAQTRHRRQREGGGRLRDREMQEPLCTAFAVETDREDGVVVSEREERVE